jgi:hypothetical protein
MLIYVKDSVINESFLIMLQQGTGDNLSDEDIEYGYVGYVNYYIDRFTGHYGDDDGFHFYDGGMYLCTQEEFRHIEQGNMEYLLDKIISYIFAGCLRNSELPDGVTYKIVDKELEE